MNNRNLLTPTHTRGGNHLPASLGLTEGVLASVLKVVRQYNRAFGLPGGDWPATPGEWVVLANWMVANLRPNVAPGTWRVYRAAIRQVCKDNPTVVGLMQIKGARRPKGAERRTSAKRKKGVGAADRAKVSAWLRENAPRWGRVASLWLDTTAMTGLRPSEWKAARLEERSGVWFLWVENGKRGAGNQALSRNEGCGGRAIPLSHLASHEIDQIRKQLLVVASMLEFGRWDTYYDACRSAIYNANRSIFPRQEKTVSLYSARHQFAAHLKEAKIETPLGALLMGHSRSDHTFKRRYGGRAAKESRPVPKAHQAVLLRELSEFDEG